MVDNTSNIKFTTGDDSFRSKKITRAKPKKEFKKVLAKDRREQREHPGEKEKVKGDKSVKDKESYENVSIQLEAAQASTKKREVSLFDLASAQEKEAVAADVVEEEIPVSELSEDVRRESLSALFKGLGSKDKLASLQKEVDMTKFADHLKTDKQSTPAGKGKTASQFIQESPDLSAINPMVTSPAASSSSVQRAEQAQSAAQNMQEIIDQIIDKLYTLKVDGKTDTLITLKHPPLFAGSSVVVTAFDTAKGEFNITFENLTQAAKQILDLKQNQESLKFGLEQKGYTVHIVTTTTLSETLNIAEGERTSEEERERQDSDDQGQRENEQH
ncbi:MAG: hypothetical protein K940chlam7_00163 [Chlamydiae bacterium]|nr:hypothetical protein [Chlamydiota bacterium]